MGEIDFERLSADFDAADIEWRIQSCGSNAEKVWAKVMPYVTCRAIMDRLDEVCGPANWRNSFMGGPEGGILCSISIRVGDEWIGKWDGADQAEESEEGGGQKIDRVKSALSSAMKRAAVQWGIGRYLYRVKPGFANVHEGGKFYGKTKVGAQFRWDPPEIGGRGSGSGIEPGAGEEMQELKPVVFLDIFEAKAEMDRAESPPELFDWIQQNRHRVLRPYKAEAMEYFNTRMQGLKQKRALA